MKPPAEAAFPRGSETVLIVDPDPEARKLAAFMLGKQGYHILEARTAADAVRLFDANQSGIDLLLTEIRIPLMNGRDLAGRLTAARPELRVLYMCAARTAVDNGRAMLPKPFTMRELAGKTRQVLDAPRIMTAGATAAAPLT